MRGCRATMSPSKLPPEPPDLQNGLLANQNQPRLCLTLYHRTSTTLTPRLAFLSPITNIWLLHPQKAFFSKNLKMIKIFFREDHRYHVLRFTLITFINLIPRKYKSVNLNSCVIRFIHLLILVCWLYQGYLLSNTEI